MTAGRDALAIYFLLDSPGLTYSIYLICAVGTRAETPTHYRLTSVLAIEVSEKRRWLRLVFSVRRRWDLLCGEENPNMLDLYLLNGRMFMIRWKKVNGWMVK